MGDPRWSPHPVVVMGWWISRLQRLVEQRAGDHPLLLRLGGAAITLLLVVGSALAGWGIERLVQGSQTVGVGWAWIGWAMLTVALASALAGRSLAQAVRAVVAALPCTPASADQPGAPRGLVPARQRLAWIVGRDTTELTEAEILRAAAETASENAVDGQFAPLFWMLVGAGLWGFGAELPGPLALAWGFKAASTLDSMLGYRRGRLQWLGTAGARLDDLLVWLPCRLVAFSLPLVQCGPLRWWPQVQASLRDGRPDPSPNAGVSQAAYAHAAGVQLGGRNRYAEGWTEKPLLAAGLPAADAAAIERILELTSRLSLLWLAVSGVVSGVISGVAVAGL